MPTNKPEVVLPDWAIAAAFRELDNCQNHSNEECGVYNEIFNRALELHRTNTLTRPADGVTAGDAVFAFAGLLTSLPHVVPFGAAAWATPGADLAAAFNAANGLTVSRDFPQGLVFPKIEGELLDRIKQASEVESHERPATGDFVMVPREDLQTVVNISMEGRAPFHSEARPALRRFAAMLSAAPQQRGQEVVDAPLDATDNADYIRHCADKLVSLGYRTTGECLRAIANSHAQPKQQAEAVAGVKLLNDVERNSLNDLLSNLEHEAGDVEDLPPSIEDDDAYWPYHQWHAEHALAFADNPMYPTAKYCVITPLYAAPPPAIDIGKLRELVARWKYESGQLLNTIGNTDAGVAVADAVEVCADELAAIIGGGGGGGVGNG